MASLPKKGVSYEIMPVVVKEGEVQVMQEVVVNAQKDNQDMEVLERYIVADSKAEPFIGTPNIDLPRTTNDVLPYYMWDSNQIEASGAKDIMDFFQNNVPMNTNRLTAFNEPTGQPFSNISIGGLPGNAGVV